MALPPSIVIAIPIVIRIVTTTATTFACIACWEREGDLASAILKHDGGARGRFRLSTGEVDFQSARPALRLSCAANGQIIGIPIFISSFHALLF
jgi:hypothetical protein